MAGKTIPIRTDREAGEADLLRDGWEKQTTLAEPRLSEAVENYRALGCEVRVIEFRSAGGGCNTCFDAGQAMGQVYGTVYTRRREGGRQEEDELF